MKRFKNTRTNDIWYAFDEEHIKELRKNTNFKELKETKKIKKVEAEKNIEDINSASTNTLK